MPIIPLISSVCSLLKSFFLSIPVFLVFCLIFLDSYSFLLVYLPSQFSSAPFFYSLLALLFVASTILTIWSYLLSIFTSSSVVDHPPPPDYFTVYSHYYPNQIHPTCQKCGGTPKPKSAHHCSICGKCILRMVSYKGKVNNELATRN
jgi:hypothetical protein